MAFDPASYNPAAAAQTAPHSAGSLPTGPVNLAPMAVQYTDEVGHYRCFVLTYGRPGVGKTHLIKTAPGPFVLSAEGGMLTFKKFAKEGLRIPFWTIDCFDRVKWALDELLKPEYNHIQTVCGDSITEICAVCLREQKRIFAHGQKAYGEMGDMMETVLSLFRQYPKHVYLTAQEEVYPAEDGLMKAGPSFPGRMLKAGIGYIPDFVFRAEIITNPQTGERSHWLRCHPSNQTEAKDRSGLLGQYEYPDLSHIFTKALS